MLIEISKHFLSKSKLITVIITMNNVKGKDQVVSIFDIYATDVFGIPSCGTLGNPHYLRMNGP
jgi:hypothetical protein